MWPVARALGEEPGVALTVRAFLPLWDPEATAVAAAAHCAAAERRFWPFHDTAASRDPLPDGAELSRIAAAVGLSAPAFAACTAAPATVAAVAAESAEAERLGLDEPPALLIDGVVFGGVQDADQLRDAVRRARDKKGPRQGFGKQPARR
jgi:protein-disulfide isomerase